MNTPYGLYQGERISVYSSVFEGHQVALYGRGTVQNCNISGNQTGIQGYFEGFTLTRNTITNNDIGVILTGLAVELNNIFGNTTYNAQVQGAANQFARNNWWGTTDTTAIEAGIYDGKDDPRLGLLNYLPFLSSPVSFSTADLSVTQTDAPDPVTVGNPLTYTVTVTNSGPDKAAGVVVRDTLPPGVTFVSASASQGICSGTSTLTCNLGMLNHSATATVTIVVTPVTAGHMTNTVTVTGTDNDPTPSNNTATSVTTVIGPALTLTLTGCTTCRAGNRFTVQAHVINPGARAVVVEAKAGVRLPDGTTVNLLSSKHLEVSLPAGLDTIVTLYDVPSMPVGVPTGTWTFEGTLLGPELGETFSREVKLFTVVP